MFLVYYGFGNEMLLIYISWLDVECGIGKRVGWIENDSEEWQQIQTVNAIARKDERNSILSGRKINITLIAWISAI